MFNIPAKFFRKFLIFFFQNFNKYYSKLILFSHFRYIFCPVFQSLIDILSSFLQNFQFFFKDLLTLDKVTVEICPNLYFILLKNFLATFRSVFKFFFDTQIIFVKKLIVSNFFCLNFILRFIKLFTKVPIFLKFHEFYLKFHQT